MPPHFAGRVVSTAISYHYASGIFRSKREVIDLASEGAMEIEGGEEEGEDDVCAQHIWLQTTFLTDESDVEDDFY